MTPKKKAYRELKKLKINNAEDYLKNFGGIFTKIEVTRRSNSKILGEGPDINIAVKSVIEKIFDNIRKCNGRLIFVGNGGSAAIALHAFADYANAGGLQTMDLMNPALITCMANDYGYENVFAKHIEVFAEKNDILFAISSSGQSQNILKACEAAKVKECYIVTFSGFTSDNPLKALGYMNFYVPSSHYGFVELAHQTILHCILDL